MPKTSISPNMARLSVVGSFGGRLQQILSLCNIAFMIFRSIAAMTNESPETFACNLIEHGGCNLIEHGGYILCCLSCGTIEESQPISIGMLACLCINCDR